MLVTVKYKNGRKKRFEDAEYIEEVKNFGEPAVAIMHGDILSVIDKEDIDKIKIKVGD